MNLAALLADTYRRLRYSSSPPSAITTRLTSFVNEVHREILSTPGMARLRDDRMTVTAIANTARSGLPPTVARINSIVDVTNNYKLRQVPLSDLRLSDPAQAFTGGYPMRYSVIGNQAVRTQPTTGTTLFVQSTAAGDTTQKVYCESVISGGGGGGGFRHIVVTAGTTLNGTTGVQLGSRSDHVEILKFYLDNTCTGFVTLTFAAGTGAEMARIEPGQTYARYLAVEWWPIQTADVTETVDYTRQVLDLVNGTDEPYLPVDFHDVLSLGARAREYEVTSDSRWQQAMGDYARRLSALKSWVLNDGDRTASLRPQSARWNSLGPTYPASYQS